VLVRPLRLRIFSENQLCLLRLTWRKVSSLGRAGLREEHEDALSSLGCAVDIALS
jgi:hypothetical protein